MDTANGFDLAVWSQMGEQLGLQGLVVPEEFGQRVQPCSSCRLSWDWRIRRVGFYDAASLLALRS